MGCLAMGLDLRGLDFWNQTHVLDSWNEILENNKPNS